MELFEEQLEEALKSNPRLEQKLRALLTSLSKVKNELSEVVSSREGECISCGTPADWLGFCEECLCKGED